MNKRKFPRYETSKKIAYTSKSKCEQQIVAGTGKIINISKSGILIESEHKLYTDSGIGLALGIEKNTVLLKCTCVYSMDSETKHYDTGLKIDKIKKGYFQLFMDFLRSLEGEIPDFSTSGKINLNMDNLALKISGEHKLIVKYVVILKNLTQNKKDQISRIDILITLKLMRKDLIKHFNIEEVFFFEPTYTLLPKEYQEMILYLRNDHKKLLSELDLVIDMVSKDEAYTNRLSSFSERIKAHAKYEISEFFPYLDNNELIKRQIITSMNKIYSSLSSERLTL